MLPLLIWRPRNMEEVLQKQRGKVVFHKDLVAGEALGCWKPAPYPELTLCLVPVLFKAHGFHIFVPVTMLLESDRDWWRVYVSKISKKPLLYLMLEALLVVFLLVTYRTNVGHEPLQLPASCSMQFPACSCIICMGIGGVSQTWNVVLMMVTGLFINGPDALITTAVSADLGSHSLRGISRVLATVTAIINGTRSLGAALGLLLTGFLSSLGWDVVFLMLMIGAFIAGILLSCQVAAEVAEKVGN